MKQTILSKVKDNGRFMLSLRSKITYTKVKKVGGHGIVITSDSSGRSFEKKGKTKVLID